VRSAVREPSGSVDLAGPINQLHGVFAGSGGEGAAVRESPDQDPWLGLLKMPALGLFGLVVLAAQRC
jgi:hypothetical protein